MVSCYAGLTSACFLCGVELAFFCVFWVALCVLLRLPHIDRWVLDIDLFVSFCYYTFGRNGRGIFARHYALIRDKNNKTPPAVVHFFLGGLYAF